jgi:hypothetical protein
MFDDPWKRSDGQPATLRQLLIQFVLTTTLATVIFHLKGMAHGTPLGLSVAIAVGVSALGVAFRAVNDRWTHWF